ncbi:MAG: MurT ligase domain-containing protein [Actinomycetota bacterium]|nr:MurT ligase domain-containing protein [Actinomycetota bacterium]
MVEDEPTVAGRSGSVGMLSEGFALRRRAAKTAARALRSLVRVVGAGAGTSLPGLLLERIDPGFLAGTIAAVPADVIVVSGTNGKTTTASMIRHILRASGATVVGNEGGSNMTRGIWSAFLDVTNATDYVVLEVDEAVAPAIVEAVQPRLLVLTNVFRDQLDRFGETERVAALLGRSTELLPATAGLVINADDPLLGYAAKDRASVGFGANIMPGQRTDAAGSEPEICPRCGEDFIYSRRTIGHLGTGHCPRCNWTCGSGGTRAQIVEARGFDGLSIEIGGCCAKLSLGGVHAAYNAAAAIVTTNELGVATVEGCRALESFSARFGRDEVIEFPGCRAHVLLMKNPAGASAVISQACSDDRLGCAVVAVNDRAADGKDVSWIWDAQFEALAGTGIPLIPSGRRAMDVALRIKYAGGNPEPAQPDVALALKQAVARCNPGEEVAVFATYTAMLELRRAMAPRRRLRRVEALR